MTQDVEAPAAEPEDPVGTAEGQRIIELLWNPPTSPPVRGPRPKYGLTDVVTAGVAIADAEGLAALSMRKVAAQLNVGVMSLYTYVPGRSELVELMIDRAYQEFSLPDTSSPWRARTRHWMQETWRIYTVHPWLLDYNQSRLPIAPHVLDVSEALYAAITDAGLRGTENVAVTNLISWQMLGAGRAVITDADETRHTGVSSEAYWESRASFWETHFDPTRYPAMAGVWEAGGFDDPVGWNVDQMIERLLDGIERLAG